MSTSVALDVFQKTRNTLNHLLENFKIPVKLLLKHSVAQELLQADSKNLKNFL